MTQFYSLFKTFSIVLGILGVFQASAQSPTTVTNSTTCAVVQDFNTNSGLFTSPSTYTMDDFSFFYSGPGTVGRFVSNPQATVPPVRSSLLSPIYSNTALNGTVVVGFTYLAPPGTLYRIRVMRPNVLSGGADPIAISTDGPPVLPNGVNNWAQLPGTSGTICLQLNDADLMTGQNHRYEFSFYATNTSTQVNFDNFALNSITAAPLPVNFMGIVATPIDNAINVRWDVGDETNVELYNLQRSTDGATFSNVGSVQAQQKSVYNTTDRNQKSPVVYYRIQSKDNDGKTKYSGIIKVVSGNSFSNTIKIYPSPAVSDITVQHSRLGAKAKITITTLDGKVVRIIKPSSGASNSMANISNLSAGMYVVRVDNGEGKIETSNFVKQ